LTVLDFFDQGSDELLLIFKGLPLIKATLLNWMKPCDLKLDRFDMLLCLLNVLDHFPKIRQLWLGMHEVITKSIVLLLLKSEAVSQLLQTCPELLDALWGLTEHINLNVEFIDVLEPPYFLFLLFDSGCFSLFLRAQLR
jgi:hypothetical protein